MVKHGEKRKDDYDKKCGNGYEESDIEVKGEETRSMGDTFGVYNWKSKLVNRTYEILGLTIGAAMNITG